MDEILEVTTVAGNEASDVDAMDEAQEQRVNALPALGERLRKRRQAAGLSLRQFAKNLDVSASFISQLENGKSQPSVATLYSICTALGVTVDELFAESSDAPRTSIPNDHVASGRDPYQPSGQHLSPAPAPITRADTPVITEAARAKLVLDTGVTWERLSALRNQPTDFLYVRYEVGGSSTPDERLTRHAGVEYGYIISGVLEITLGFDTYQVKAGDAVSFNSDVPHRLHNVGEVPVEAIWFVHGH